MWLWFMALGILIIDLFAVLTTSDKLVRLQHDSHFDAWVADGRPEGVFVHFAESDWLLGRWTSDRMVFAWVFSTPEWMCGDVRALGLLRRMRWTACIWWVGMPAWFICVVPRL